MKLESTDKPRDRTAPRCTLNSVLVTTHATFRQPLRCRVFADRLLVIVKLLPHTGFSRNLLDAPGNERDAHSASVR